MSDTQANTLFPVFLKLDEMNLLIVGGGKVGMEKLNAVRKNSPGCKITLVSKAFEGPDCPDGNTDRLAVKRKAFEDSDLDGQDVVIVAVGDTDEAEKIRKSAKKRKLLVNVADKPGLCDFYLGSIVQKGDLKIAISTNGKSPTLAKRVKETLDDVFPDETQEVLENLSAIRNNLKGDFKTKVKKMNEITSVLVAKRSLWKRIARTTLFSLAILLVMIAGHLIITYTPWKEVGGFAASIYNSLDENFWLYVGGGFLAQMIDGALGMAYGVSVTTFLLSLGLPAITPAVASASMHASEVFTTGSSSLVYFRYRNINMKLFRKLVFPGAIGAVAGAATISFLSKDAIAFVKPFVAVYTLLLGVYIIVRAIRLVNNKAYKIKTIQPVAGIGGFLDSVGGGGWGPIVTTSLIAGGRNLRYSIGSSHLAKFFVAIVSTLSFFFFIGLDHWQIIFGLVVGGSIAAPLSIWFSNKIPTKAGLIMVGSVVIIVSLRIIILSII